MSDLIRAYYMKISHKGTCRKCGVSRENGSHKSCDRWPSGMTMQGGLHYEANSKETTLADLKKIVEVICEGDSDDTPVQFTIRIRQRAK